MKDYKRIFPALGIIFFLMFGLAACNDNNENAVEPADVSTTNEAVNLNQLSELLAEDQTHIDYIQLQVKAYEDRMEVVNTQYNGDYDAYMEDVTALYNKFEAEGWNDANAAEFATKTGTSVELLKNIQNKIVALVDKYPTLKTLSSDDLNLLSEQSAGLMVKAGIFGTENAKTTNCASNCDFETQLCIASALGVSAGVVGACFTALACTPCFLGCVGFTGAGAGVAIAVCQGQGQLCKLRC